MKTLFTNSLMIVVLALSLASCKKDQTNSCYDKAFHEQNKTAICTADCPGVIGCDGKTYCNECIMHTHGITRVK